MDVRWTLSQRCVSARQLLWIPIILPCCFSPKRYHPKVFLKSWDFFFRAEFRNIKKQDQSWCHSNLHFYSPLPQVKWYRNGIEVNINDSSLYRVNARLPEKFTILKMTDELAGKYKCQFTNRAGMSEATGDVIVASKRAKVYFVQCIISVLPLVVGFQNQ